MNTTLDDVLALAEQLNSQEQNLLIYRLRAKQLQQSAPPDRAMLLYLVDSLRQTIPNPEGGLLGRYARPELPDISAEELHAQIHHAATEWERDLDEFDTDSTS